MKKIINIKEYEKDIRIIAHKLSKGNEFLAEDLRSEMYISILTSGAEKDKSLCLRKAKCKAIDYLRSKAGSYSYKGMRKHISLDVIEELGYQIDTEGNVYPPRGEMASYFDDMKEE